MATLKRLCVPAVALALLFALPGAALATDGYFSLGFGTACKAMAGACASLPLDTIAPATNPAAMVFLGGRYDISVELFHPVRDFEIVGAPSGFPGTFGLAPGKVQSDSEWFVIPALGANWKLSQNATLGVAVYGNGGMNTDYAAPVFGFKPAGVDLAQLFVAPTLAVKVAEGQAVGVAGVVAFQRFRAKGVQAFVPFSSDPQNLIYNHYDTSWGYGARVGYLGDFGVVSVGASYQTKVWMARFQHYAGLFAEQGDFDIPSTWTVGLSGRPVEALTLAVDYQRILYSGVRSIANPVLPNLMTARLGDDGGAGFGWKDMPVWKFGLAYAATPSWTVRGGYSVGDQPISSSDVLFNILAPGVVEKHASFGLSYRGKSAEWNLAVVRAFSHTVSGPNPLEVPGQQRIKLRMDQWEFQLGAGFGF